MRGDLWRLIRKVRNDFVDARDYDWTYVYDAGGNRTLKKEAANVSINPLQRFEEDYEYDVDDPAKYGTANNRLMKIVRTRFDTDPGDQQSSTFFDPNRLRLAELGHDPQRDQDSAKPDQRLREAAVLRRHAACPH